MHKDKRKYERFIRWIFLLTILYCIYLAGSASLLHADVSWFFLNAYGYKDFGELYPGYTKTAYFLFKIVPFAGLAVLSLLHVFILFMLRKRMDIYRQAINEMKIVSYARKYWLEAGMIVFSLLIWSSMAYNKPYCFSLLFSVLLFYAFYKLRWLETNKGMILFLIIIAVILRLCYVLQTGFYDTREDSLARIAQVYSWDQFGGIPGNLTWLPAYHILVYSISWLFRIPFEAGGSVLSMLSCIGLCISGFLLAERLFNKNIAFLTIGFFVFNPFFVKFSVIQMVEIPFVFSIFSALYFAYRYFSETKLSQLLWALFFFNLANLLRFEGWIITPLLALVFLLQYRDLKKTLKLFVPALFSAFLIALLSFIVKGDPVYGVTASDIEVTQAMQLRGGKIFDTVWRTLVDNRWMPVYFIPLTFAGLFRSAVKGSQKYMAAGILLLLSYYLFKMFTGTLEPFWRYFSFVIILSLPFTFHFLGKWLHFSWMLLFVFFIFPFWTLQRADHLINGVELLPEGFVESSQVFKNKSRHTDKIILSINPYNDDDLWMAFSGRKMRKNNCFTQLFPGSIRANTQEPFTVDHLKKKVMEEKYDWILIEEAYPIDSLFADKEFSGYYNSVSKQSDTIGKYILIQIKH